MASVTVRGKAVVEGFDITFDVVLYPVQQTGKMTQNFEEEIIKDPHGFDVSWLARNEHEMFDIGLKLLGDTHAHALAGAAFLAPLAVVTVSGAAVSLLNTTYQVVSGGDIDLGNTKVGDFNLKLRKYADSTQNTLAATTPS